MVDKLKIEQAVRLLLEGIGEDITREGLIDTPDRIARSEERRVGKECRSRWSPYH